MSSEIIHKPSFDDYLAEVENAAKANSHWRMGQVAFNVLFKMRPDLSEQVRATVLDPFYDRSLPAQFVDWVKGHWDGN